MATYRRRQPAPPARFYALLLFALIMSVLIVGGALELLRPEVECP
jgi:hypothetical protein